MAIDQCLIKFFPHQSKLFLTPLGWTVRSFNSDITKKEALFLAKQYYPLQAQEQIQNHDLFLFANDIGELRLIFKDDVLTSLAFRISLRHRNLDIVKEKAREILQIAKDFHLSAFRGSDGNGKFVNDSDEMVQCILNSRAGKIYFKDIHPSTGSE